MLVGQKTKENILIFEGCCSCWEREPCCSLLAIIYTYVCVCVSVSMMTGGDGQGLSRTCYYCHRWVGTDPHCRGVYVSKWKLVFFNCEWGLRGNGHLPVPVPSGGALDDRGCSNIICAVRRYRERAKGSVHPWLFKYQRAPLRSFGYICGPGHTTYNHY